ncbi:aminotransferase class III-fold pyridoxal phosphate-dependent enzyme, partial [bacterium]|nr:aminotransferase class III-fold pyridoxal phosphate-dependent enzyme [candidate division CSSED10-310 bacterium]
MPENEPIVAECAGSRLVGGVISGWNSYRECGRFPITRASGCMVMDSEGNSLIDWIMGWGSLLLGHSAPVLHAAVMAAFERGFGMQYETEANEKLAGEICDAVPGMEKVRLANSGSEATLHALRVARAFTGRKKIVKFEGHFHGLNEYLMFGLDCSPQTGRPLGDGSLSLVAGS